MGPIGMGILAAAPSAFKFGQQVMGGLADARAAQQANMPAADPMSYQNPMMKEMQPGGLYDPNGPYQRSLEQRGVRQSVQDANLDNRQLNEAMKRRYVMDTYSNAQNMGGRAIDSYLQGNAQAISNRAQLGMAFSR